MLLDKIETGMVARGVAMYINILLSGPLGLEFVLVTLIRDPLKLCLGVFYRPLSSGNSIFDTFSDALLTINQSYLSDLIIIGDFNIIMLISSFTLHVCPLDNL